MALAVGYEDGPGYADCYTVPGQGRGGLQMVETTAGQSGLERVLQMWNELDVPEDSLVDQVTLEGAMMSPPPGPRHRNTVEELHRLLVVALTKNYRVHQNTGLVVAEEPGIYIPDLLVAPRGSNSREIPSEDVLLAVEVTSPGNADNDRALKYHAYARGRVPRYLLIDPVFEGAWTVTLFTRPAGDEYTNAVQVPYGESVTVELPVPVVIDTRLFPFTDED